MFLHLKTEILACQQNIIASHALSNVFAYQILSYSIQQDKACMWQK